MIQVIYRISCKGFLQVYDVFSFLNDLFWNADFKKNSHKVQSIHFFFFYGSLIVYRNLCLTRGHKDFFMFSSRRIILLSLWFISSWFLYVLWVWIKIVCGVSFLILCFLVCLRYCFSSSIASVKQLIFNRETSKNKLVSLIFLFA